MQALTRKVAQVAACGRRFAADERGATAIEYGLITSCIGVAIILTVFQLGTTLKQVMYEKIQTELTKVVTK